MNMDRRPPQNNKAQEEPQAAKRLRNAVILPDGTRHEPMGSGVITGILGVGGMANVYEIWNSQLEMARAVKLLHPNYTADSKQRFETEIKITSKLHHPNIIEIHAVGQWNGLPYIEMERIDGFTLERLITDRGALPIEVCTSIGILIGRALRFAHNQEYVIYGQTYHGVIHRDLKPSNIMVGLQGGVKLMDFGIARPTDASIHTVDGAILGTMQYLSPEQLDGKDTDIRTDLYSMGTILYEMVTGVKAFPENNVSKLMLSKIKNDYKHLNQYEIQIPQRFHKLVHRCMVHDRTKRVQDALSFLAEITKIHRSLTDLNPEQVMRQFMSNSVVERNVVPVRRKSPATIMVSGAMLLLMVIAMAALLPHLFHSRQTIHAKESPRTAPTAPLQLKELPSVKQMQAGNLPVAPKPKASRTIAVKSMSPVPAAPSPQLLDNLENEYGTSDMMSILAGEAGKKHFNEVLEVFDHLSPDLQHSDKAVIFKMRALSALGKKIELRNLIETSNVNDAEFYLEKAKVYLYDGNRDQAAAMLELCSKSPSNFSDPVDIRRDRLYYAATCKTRDFDADPTQVTMRAALDSWYDLKEELRTMQDHRYFKEATTEMDRIAAQMSGK